MAITASLGERWPILAREPTALAWLVIRSDLGLAPRTLDAYSRGLSEYLVFCATASTDPLTAGRDHIARYVRELTQRPPRRASANTVPSCDEVCDWPMRQYSRGSLRFACSMISLSKRACETITRSAGAVTYPAPA
jgi:hypothetical protein